MPITYSTPWSIELAVDGRTVEISADAQARGHGGPDFVAYVDSTKTWADGSPIRPDEKARIIDELRRSAKQKGWSVEIK